MSAVSGVLWEIVGDVWKVGKTKYQDDIGLGRKILLVAPLTFTAEDVLREAEAALLHRWNDQQPHQVEVLSIVKTKTEVVVP